MSDLRRPGERQAEAILEAKKLAHEAQVQGQSSKDALRDLEVRLHIVRATHDDPDLARLLDRVQHVQRLYNSMELGSLVVRTGNVLNEAWGRLP